MKKRIQKLNYCVLVLLLTTLSFVACEQETLVSPIIENELAFNGVDDILAGRYTKSIEVFDVEGANSVQLTIAAKSMDLLEKYDCNTISLIPKSEIEEGMVNNDRAEDMQDPPAIPEGDLSEKLDNAIIIKVESQNLQEDTKELNIQIDIEEQLEERNIMWHFWYAPIRKVNVQAPTTVGGRYHVYHYNWYVGCQGWCYSGYRFLYPNFWTSFIHPWGDGQYHGVYIGHENSLGRYSVVTWTH